MGPLKRPKESSKGSAVDLVDQHNALKLMDPDNPIGSVDQTDLVDSDSILPPIHSADQMDLMDPDKAFKLMDPGAPDNGPKLMDPADPGVLIG